MTDFDDMLNALNELKHEAPDVQKYLAHLLDIQNKSKLINFQKYSSEKVSQILDSFWLFLMHSSSNCMNPSVRIAAVRAAAYLTLNLYPFFPNEIQTTFANIATISTIDMAASSLIASVFGIISFHISTPYRPHFLQSCPIFHHITEPKNNQEYFISSLSHYTHLGLEFHRFIIKSFMIKITADVNDKLYWHAVIEIVKNSPKELFFEVYNPLLENNIYRNYIQFMSCLLTIPDSPINQVDLFDIAKYALTMLSEFSSNSRDLTWNEKCAIFTILSLKTNSFYVECQTEGKETLKISLTDQIQSNKAETKCQIPILDDTPEFYLLNLPPELAFPNGEEGSTLLAAKLSLLITYLDSDNEELVQRILDVIKNYVSKPYDTTVSACFQGISKSIPKLKNRDVLDSLTKILDLSIFSPSMSWFHDMDRLKVIEALPLDAISRAMDNKLIVPTFDQVLIWAKEKNGKLAKYAQQVLIQSFIMRSDAEYLLAHIIKGCDIFDSFDLLRTLEILNLYLGKYRKQFMPKFLIDFCKAMMQLFSLYPDDPDVYIEILTFISYFHIKKLRTYTIHVCLAVVLSTYNIITGMEATFRDLDQSLVEQEYKMINSVLSKQSMDIIKENLNDYASYAPHLYTTLRFLISIQNLDFKYVQLVVQYTIDLFPYEASQLMFKHWKNLPQMSRTSFLSSNYNVVKNAGGFNCAGIWFELYMKTSDTVPDSNSNSYQAVASGPFAYPTYSNQDSFSSLNSKIQFSNAFECLKEFMEKSLDYMALIDERVIIYYIHFYKFVFPTKQFDYNLIPDAKRARVITLINRAPSKTRKRRNKNYASSSFNQNKLGSIPLTSTSSAPVRENMKSSSMILPQMSIPMGPSLIGIPISQDSSSNHHKNHNESSSASDLSAQEAAKTNSSQAPKNDDDDDNDAVDNNNNDEDEIHSSEAVSNSESDSESDNASDSICLPSTIQKSGSASLSGSSSPTNSESGFLVPNNQTESSANISSSSLIDLSPFASGDSFLNISRRASFLSEFDSPIGSANISPSSSSLNTLNLIQFDDNEVDHEDTPVEIYVPIEFPFESPKVTTMDQLSEKLPIDDPLVEVQLKHNTYDFDEDELGELYEFYSSESNNNNSINKKNSARMIDLIIKYAEKNEVDFEIPKELKDQRDSSVRHQIATMKESDKINKKLLIQLCHEINDNGNTRNKMPKHKRRKSELEREEPDEDPETISIINKLLNSITESTKEPKLRLLLFTLGNLMCTYHRIPFETAKLIITNFNDNFSKLPLSELSICIETFCQRVCKKGRPARFLTRMQSMMNMFNVGGEGIVNSLAFCRLLSQKDAVSITQKFLNEKSLPSSFRNSIIIMTIVADDPNLNTIDMFNFNIQSFMSVYKTFKRNEPIHRQVAIYFNTIFKERNYENIGRNSNVIVSTFQFPSNSLYTSYSICIPRFAKFVIWNNKANFDLKDSRLIPFCKEYFELLNVEIQNTEDKKAFALKKIDNFIEAIDKGKVCIERLDEYILNWFIFLNQFFKFEGIVKRLIPLSNIRFNPFFLGIIKFVKFHKKQLTDDEIENITNWKKEAHSNAFKFGLTNNQDLINAAIKLSYYEDDTEESMDLIRKCNKYYSKMNEKE